MEKLLWLIVLFISCVTSDSEKFLQQHAKRSRVSIVTIPTSMKPATRPVEKWWCRSARCLTTDHCKSVVLPASQCCSRCGCKNELGRNVNVNERFRLENVGNCYECKCVNDWRGKYATCNRMFRCPTLTCKKQYKPPGKCCPICGKEESSSDNSFRLPFPDFPEIHGL
ncbi:kielin/chordin-like protein [Hydractinia symbiolongicarpus]|uniref:kielin/chordin-like protein n=1 Tax=Hydractinia symbiolongicarpus TaxID=13093 RepID=UPI00254D40CE|nr:kielin/chordin-like protein [Hydractinia symbiolongicarpus]